MFALLKMIPVIAILAVAGYGYHWFVVTDLESTVSNLNTQIVTYKSNEDKLKTAIEQQTQAFIALEKNMKQQQEAMGNLSKKNSELTAERDKYLSIFKKHNLTKLALRKPGLIETRINKGTNDVFRSVEQDSKEVDNADN